MLKLKDGVPKRLLFDNQITKLPREFNKVKIIFVFTTLFYSGINLFSFFIELGKNHVQMYENNEGAWHAVLAVILIALYFIKGSLSKSFDLWFDAIQLNNEERLTTSLNKACVELLSKLKGKVFKKNKDTGILEAMTENQFIDSSRNYIQTYWRYSVSLPSRITDILLVVVMFLGFSKVSLSSVLITILAILSFSICYMARKRVQFHKKQKPLIKEAEQQRNEWINDILNIRAVNDKHTTLMVSRIVKSFEKRFSLVRTQLTKLNQYTALESLFLIIAIVAIILYQCRNATITTNFILDLISILTIFSTIVKMLKNVVQRVERMLTDIKDIEAYYPDMKLILEEFEKIKTVTKHGHPAKVTSVAIPSITIQYMKKGKENTYSLTIPNEFKFVPGDVVFVTGPTGCGKTTLLKAISNRMKFDGFEIQYYTVESGDIETEFFETDSKMGAGSVLSELVFDEENYDKEKLLKLFDMLHITDFLSSKEDDIFEYLKTAKAGDFSHGQKQRLLLARNLYNLDPSAVTISMDEVTSGLNDEICEDVLKAILEYCKDRIVFIASHQVSIVRRFANKRIEYQELAPEKYTITLIEE